MSNSKQLSKQRLNTNIVTANIKNDKKLFEIIAKVSRKLSNLFGIKISHETSMKNIDLYNNNSNFQYGHNLTCKMSSVRPDGGILFVSKNGKKFAILISENKKQGDGKKQAKGNAIERAGKNIMFAQSLLKDETIFPYVIFCHGTDFIEGSYIIDRLGTMCHYQQLNQINLLKDKTNLGGQSIFYGEYRISQTEIYNICYEIALRSLAYYIIKYKL